MATHPRLAIGRPTAIRQLAATMCRTALCAAAVACACLGSAAPANAGSSQLLTAAVVPSAIALTPRSSATGTLILDNTGTTPIEDIQVAPTAASTSVDVVMPVTTADVPAAGSVSLSFTVTRRDEGPAQDIPVRFVVTYTQPVSSTSLAVPQTLVAELIVKAVADPQLVQATIQANVTAIDENRPGDGALIVTNLREAQIIVKTVEVSAPDAVDVDLDCPAPTGKVKTPGGMTKTWTNCAFLVAPDGEEILHFRMTTSNTVAPGPRSLVMRIVAQDTETNATAGAVASLPFTLDVFAESDILKSVGVPIFLLLPGVIVVVTFVGLMRLKAPWTKQAGPLSASDVIGAATFGSVIGLGISLFIALIAYPLLTYYVWPHEQRNYLKAYGFADFYYVFVYSLAFAIICWLVTLLVSAVHFRFLVPAADDEPAQLFRKMMAHSLLRRDTRFRRGAILNKGKGLQASRGPNGGRMIVPTLQISFPRGVPAGLLEEIEKHATTGKPLRLWMSVNRARSAHKAVLAYRHGDVSVPTEETDAATLEPSSQHGAVVEIAYR